jgi:dihydrofolate reductase
VDPAPHPIALHGIGPHGIGLIVAMAEGRVIGAGGRLPWHLPADLRHFRTLTLGKPIVMGRRTFESIGRPLPGRTNIVVTRDPEVRGAGVWVARDLETALAMARPLGEVMVIGGASIYARALPLCERIYLTEVHAKINGDTWFPDYDPGEWREYNRSDHPPDPANRYPYSFVVLERVRGSRPRSARCCGAPIQGPLPRHGATAGPEPLRDSSVSPREIK